VVILEVLKVISLLQTGKKRGRPARTASPVRQGNPLKGETVHHYLLKKRLRKEAGSAFVTEKKESVERKHLDGQEEGFKGTRKGEAWSREKKKSIGGK